MITVNLEASTKADWDIQIEALDVENESVINFTGASVGFVVQDLCGGTVLSASTTLGNITITSTLIEVQFTATQMGSLCPGIYNLGCIYELNSVTTQLLIGTVNIYDGIASL